MSLTLEQEKIKKHLKDFVKNWRSTKPGISSGVLKGNDLIDFVKDLQNEIVHTTSFLPNSGDTLILYSGTNTSGIGWYDNSLLPDFCNKNSEGAAMSVESTIVPFLRIRLCLLRISF